MTRVTSIFSQLLQLFPRAEFDALVRKHRAERHARGFTCWGQLVAMLFCQLGRAHSLREIGNGLAASEGKLKHLGLRDAPRRSTLSYANEHRPWQLFRSVFEQLYARCVVEAQGRTGQRFSLPGRLLSMDSTMISTCTSLFEWARYTRRKGAVKLHLLLDHDGYLPQFAVITDGLRSDLSVGMTMPFEPGATVVFDRGYYRFGWWLSLTRRHVFFVGRRKENARFTVLRQNPVAPGTAIRKDEVIVAPGQKRAGEEAHFRRIELYDEAKQETVVFVTNHHQLDPDRTVLQEPEATTQDQDLHRDQRKRRAHPDLDGLDRHAGGALPAPAFHLRMEPIQPRRAPAAATLRPPASLDLAERPVPASGQSTGATAAVGGGSGMIWTAGGNPVLKNGKTPANLQWNQQRCSCELSNLDSSLNKANPIFGQVIMFREPRLLYFSSCVPST